MARVLSINVGQPVPTTVSSAGRTAIGKHPVAGPVAISAPGPRGVGGSGLAGDAVCDLRHHGGDDQAVYAYAREDLDHFAAELDRELAPGLFGENLTTAGIDLGHAVLGETWSLGDGLILRVSVPRIPCRTFAATMGERAWMRRFTAAGRPGTYLRVLTPGPVSTGDIITVIDRPAHGVTVRVAFSALTTRPELLPALSDVPNLPAALRSRIARRVSGSGQAE